jgi:hypothetical protein
LTAVLAAVLRLRLTSCMRSPASSPCKHTPISQHQHEGSPCNVQSLLQSNHVLTCNDCMSASCAPATMACKESKSSRPTRQLAAHCAAHQQMCQAAVEGPCAGPMLQECQRATFT